MKFLLYKVSLQSILLLMVCSESVDWDFICLAFIYSRCTSTAPWYWAMLYLLPIVEFGLSLTVSSLQAASKSEVMPTNWLWDTGLRETRHNCGCILWLWHSMQMLYVSFTFHVTTNFSSFPYFLKICSIYLEGASNKNRGWFLTMTLPSLSTSIH